MAVTTVECNSYATDATEINEGLDSALVLEKFAAATPSKSSGRPSFARGCVVLLVFCIHQAYGVWAPLTLTADVPAAERLFNVDEAKLGLINTFGPFCILLALPLAMLCRWRRVVLFVSAFLNLAPVPLRYFAAVRGDFALALATSVQGCGFGLQVVWPVIIAQSFFSEERWSVVIAIASLSNALGGGLGAEFTPWMTNGTPEGLTLVIQCQAWLALGVLALTFSWLWIPDTPAEVAGVSFRQDLRACCTRPKILTRALVYGTIMGIAIMIQCMNPLMLVGVGFSAKDAGACNCAYQLAAAVIGIALGSVVTHTRQLKQVIRWLHVLGVASAFGMLALCMLVAEQGRSAIAFAGMILVQSLLGASVMGLLPFALHEATISAKPASEMFVAGLLNVVAMALAVVLNYVGAMIPELWCARLIAALVFSEAFCFAALERWWMSIASDLEVQPIDPC